MPCSLCKKYGITGKNGLLPWATSGCKTIRLDKVKDHEKGEYHPREAINLEIDNERRENEERRLADCFAEMRTEEEKTIAAAMKCMYWLAKEHVAHTTKFDLLVKLVTDLGCAELKNLNVARNATYNSEQTMQEFISVLSKEIEDDLTEKMRASPSIAILLDETTDISVLKQMIVYCRILVNGELRSNFLTITELIDGKADTIVKALKEFLSSKNVDLQQITALGSDGASVMIRKKNGVSAKLKQDNPSLINIHCIAHRLALAAKDSFADIPYLKRYEEIMSCLYKFYQNSSVRTAGLKEIQRILEEPSVKLKEAKHVRWLSHDAASETLRRSLNAVIVSLEREADERGNPAALGLVHMIKTYRFVAMLHLLCDVLPHLSRLSKTFQKREVNLAHIEPMLKATITTLRKLREEKGPHLKKVDEVLRVDLRTHKIPVNDTDKANFEKLRDKFLASVISNLEARFPDSEVISALSVLDPTNMPTEFINFSMGKRKSRPSGTTSS